jgi:hypothetical protein
VGSRRYQSPMILFFEKTLAQGKRSMIAVIGISVTGTDLVPFVLLGPALSETGWQGQGISTQVLGFTPLTISGFFVSLRGQIREAAIDPAIIRATAPKDTPIGIL